MAKIVESDGAGKISTFEKRFEGIVGEGIRAHDAAGVGREDEVGILPEHSC